MRTGWWVSVLLAGGCTSHAPGGDDQPAADAGRPDAMPPPPMIDAGPPDAQVVSTIPPEVDGRIVINEVMAANVLTVVDEDGRASDWVELYNPTDQDIPLYGYALTDDLTLMSRSLIPNGPVLHAGGRMLFWLDGAPERGPRHAAFELDRDGDDLALIRPDGTFIDRVQVRPQEVDFSAAREPDGSDAWVIEWHPSPGMANPDGNGDPMGLEDLAEPPEPIPAAGDLSERILAYDVLPQFELLVPPESAASLLAAPQTWAPVHLRFRGRDYGPVGARLKGSDTFQPYDQKPSWRINIDEFVPGAKFFGLDDLTLNNMTYDASMMHERLAYWVARSAGVPASRSNHAIVRVNGELYGLYANVETVKARAVARWFADASGPLFESEGADFIPSEVWAFEHESGPDDRTMLVGTAAALTNPDPAAAIAAAGAYVHMPKFHRFWGMCAVIGQFDSFPHYDDDFYQYADPETHRLWFMPWGMDETFGSSSYDPTSAFSVLGTTCRAVPSCLQGMANHAWEILDLTEEIDLLGEVTRVANQIAPYVVMDTRKPFSNDQVAAGQQAIRYFLLARRDQFTAYLPPPEP